MSESNAERRARMDKRLHAAAQRSLPTAASDYVWRARRGWLAARGSSEALGDAHRLLSDNEIEKVVKAEIVSLMKEFRAPAPIRFASGEYLIPDQSDLLIALRPAVVRALRDGWFIATGIGPDRAISSKPVNIPADRWEYLTPDWERSAATCEGKVVAVGITVEAAQLKPHVAASAGSISAADLRRWVNEHGSKVAGGQRGVWAAAKAKFGARVKRKPLLDLYKTVKPSRPGRPQKNART